MESVGYLYELVMAKISAYERNLLKPEKLLISPEMYLDLTASGRNSYPRLQFLGLPVGVDVRLRGREFEIIVAET